MLVPRVWEGHVSPGLYTILVAEKGALMRQRTQPVHNDSKATQVICTEQ